MHELCIVLLFLLTDDVFVVFEELLGFVFRHLVLSSVALVVRTGLLTTLDSLTVLEEILGSYHVLGEVLSLGQKLGWWT